MFWWWKCLHRVWIHNFGCQRASKLLCSEYAALHCYCCDYIRISFFLFAGNYLARVPTKLTCQKISICMNACFPFSRHSLSYPLHRINRIKKTILIWRRLFKCLHWLHFPQWKMIRYMHTKQFPRYSNVSSQSQRCVWSDWKHGINSYILCNCVDDMCCLRSAFRASSLIHGNRYKGEHRVKHCFAKWAMRQNKEHDRKTGRNPSAAFAETLIWYSTHWVWFGATFRISSKAYAHRFDLCVCKWLCCLRLGFITIVFTARRPSVCTAVHIHADALTPRTTHCDFCIVSQFLLFSFMFHHLDPVRMSVQILKCINQKNCKSQNGECTALNWMWIYSFRLQMKIKRLYAEYY